MIVWLIIDLVNVAAKVHLLYNNLRRRNNVLRSKEYLSSNRHCTFQCSELDNETTAVLRIIIHSSHISQKSHIIIHSNFVRSLKKD